MVCRFVCFFLALFMATPALAIKATVTEVRSCDSILLVDDAGKKVSIRLFGVVCPDPGGDNAPPQPFSAEAVAFLRGLLPRGLSVDIHDMRLDTMGRERGHTITLPEGGLVQPVLLGAGLAWVAPWHCGACTDWKKAEKKARAAGHGLWGESEPLPPWEWQEKAGTR